ncbi:MAG: PAS domain-containing protein, partial [Anaerolineales bacterium]
MEDRPEDAELIVHHLRQVGFEPEVRRVDREPEFLAALSPDVDIVLADFALPEFDGLRALDLVAQSGLAIPFILVSGSVGEERAVEVMRRGAADYILKDRMARLGAAVARALENSRLQRQFHSAMAELREAERQYRSLVEQLPAVTYMVELGGAGRTRYISPQVETMLGVSPQIWQGDPDQWRRVIHPEDRGWVEREIRRRDEEGRPLDLEYRVVAADERVLWIRNQSVLVRDAQGKPLYAHGVMFDITARKQAEGEILRRTLELDALLRIGQEMSRLAEPTQILELIFTLVGEVLDNHNFTVALYDEERKWVEFPIRFENGVRRQASGREFSNRITEHVLRSRRTILLNGDVQQQIRAMGVESSGPPASSY